MRNKLLELDHFMKNSSKYRSIIQNFFIYYRVRKQIEGTLSKL